MRTDDYKEKDYHPLMFSILKKYHLYDKKDDYLDICYIGYAKALNSYDENKSTFSNYVYKCMENELLKEIKRETAQKRLRTDVSLDECIYTQNDLKSLEMAENGKIEDDMVFDETKKELYNAISLLTDREQDVLTNMWNLRSANLSRKQLAEKYELSQTHITNINNKAMKKIKSTINNN